MLKSVWVCFLYMPTVHTKKVTTHICKRSKMYTSHPVLKWLQPWADTASLADWTSFTLLPWCTGSICDSRRTQSIRWAGRWELTSRISWERTRTSQDHWAETGLYFSQVSLEMQWKCTNTVMLWIFCLSPSSGCWPLRSLSRWFSSSSYWV